MLKKIFLYTALAAIGIIAVVIGLFIINGLWLAHGENPVSGTTSHPPKSWNKDSDEIRIMAYNIAKGFVHKGGIRFQDEKSIRERMKAIAEIISREQPDLVFLSEIVFECTPCPVNQVTFLAESTGMHSWVFGENYNFGLPFYRIVGGHAILSRIPIEPLANPSLAGSKPFYITRNNRRVLWCHLKIGGEDILAASVRNDSFNLANNLVQTRQLLDYAAGRTAIMAGDFNATPNDSSIKLIRNTERFKAAFAGPPTFPSGRATQKIDFVFAPSGWELVDHRVIEADVSDHYPVVSVFRFQE